MPPQIRGEEGRDPAQRMTHSSQDFGARSCRPSHVLRGELLEQIDEEPAGALGVGRPHQGVLQGAGPLGSVARKSPQLRFEFLKLRVAHRREASLHFSPGRVAGEPSEGRPVALLVGELSLPRRRQPPPQSWEEKVTSHGALFHRD